ncbi:MAG: hypothetical protein V1887_00465 [Candidatus Aenigmatarchaeota archaeon]
MRMEYAMKTTKEMAIASTTLRASPKTVLKICRALNRKQFAVAQAFTDKLVAHEVSMDGKFHDKAAEGLRQFLREVENNAKQKKLEPKEMKLMISMHQAPKMMRGRRRRRHGMLMKNAHVQAVLVPVQKKEKKETKKA